MCALILLPIATNIATGIALPDFLLHNKWISWVGVVTFGVIAVIALLQSPPPPPPPQPPPLPPLFTDEPVPAGPDQQLPEEPTPTKPQESRPVRVGSLPAKVWGRDDLLKKLRSHHKDRGLAVLVGAGGTGKSTAARKLVHQIRQDTKTEEQPPTWEVSGADPRILVDDLEVVASSLGASEVERAVIKAGGSAAPDTLWDRLEQAPEGWVLIVDNADDVEFLARPSRLGEESRHTLAEGTGWVRTSKRGLVIVTSRQRERRYWPADAKLYSVGNLTDAQGAQMLRTMASHAGSHAQAKALAHRLGGLPLALHLAGLYLGSGYGTYRHPSFDAYREALESDPTVIRLIELSPNDPEKAERMMVMVTWELSLDALAKHGIPQARPLLRLLSCYAAAVPIPLTLLDFTLVDSFFRDIFPDLESHPRSVDLRVDQVLQSLDQLGLVASVLPSGNRPANTIQEQRISGLVLHPVVVDTNRTHLMGPRPGDPPELLVRQTAVRLLAAALDDLSNARPSTWTTVEALAPHLQALLKNSGGRLETADVDTLIRVAGDSATAYDLMNAPDFGAELITSALAHRPSKRLSDGNVILVAWQQLARLLGHMGHHAEAGKIFRGVLSFHSEKWPVDDPANLAAGHNVAASMAAQGRWVDARSRFDQILDDERRLLGEFDRTTFVTRLEYAVLLGRHNSWGEAEAALREILADATQELGADDRFTLMVRHDLALAIWYQDRRDEAKSIIGSLLTDERKILGEDDLITATTGRYGDGGMLTVVLLSTPDLHVRFAPLLFKRGITMAEEGKRERAVEVLDELLARFGDDSSTPIRELVGDAMFRRAVILHKLEQRDQAVAGFTQVAERHINDADKAMRTLAALALYNTAILSRDKPEEALRAIERAVACYQELAQTDVEAFGEKLTSAQQLFDSITVDVARAMFDAAVQLASTGRQDEAVRRYDELDGRFHDDPSPALRVLLANALVRKAAILEQLGDAEEGADA